MAFPREQAELPFGIARMRLNEAETIKDAITWLQRGAWFAERAAIPFRYNNQYTDRLRYETAADIYRIRDACEQWALSKEAVYDTHHRESREGWREGE